MTVAIIALCFANGAPCPHEGQYLEAFDFEHGDGVGWGEFTSDPVKAKRFDDTVAAMTFWKIVPTCRPLREDGKPNRPLTALCVEIREIGR